MKPFLPTIILRHRKENLKKCSLRGLEKREDLLFFTYPIDSLPDLSSYILLKVDAPLLSEEDANKGLFLLDSTWKYAPKMEKSLPNMQYRSLPSYKTAYPRKQTQCPIPERGLATIEALYLAYFLTKKDPEGLLDHYYWKDQFLLINRLVNIPVFS